MESQRTAGKQRQDFRCAQRPFTAQVIIRAFRERARHVLHIISGNRCGIVFLIETGLLSRDILHTGIFQCIAQEFTQKIHTTVHFFPGTQRCGFPFLPRGILSSPEIHAVPEIGAGIFARMIIDADELQVSRTFTEPIELCSGFFRPAVLKSGAHGAPQTGQIQNSAVPERFFVYGNEIMAVKIGGNAPLLQNGKHLGSPACTRLTVTGRELSADILHIPESLTFPAFKRQSPFTKALVTEVLGLGGVYAVAFCVIADFVTGEFFENIGASALFQHPDFFSDDFERAADSQ